VLLGSEYTYLRGLAAVRGWWSPIPELADLVLAGRALIDVQSEGTPFFTMSQMPFTEDPHFGLGGHRTMRGFRQDRFVDHVMSAANVELRWTFARTTLKRQKLAFIVTPFLDLGRTFPSVSDLTLRGWFPSYGGAFRVSWNLATLVTFDYGICAESTGFYVNFGHTF
jgi:outer membrane protein assembly factor BamA